METDSNAISIPDLLKKGKYDGSIITTYNAFLPYYEEVVLRKLQAGGCRNNVLLMDARQLKECLNTPSLRPRLAGFEYTLLPIQASGAFHPKIICLIGEKKGCALVGSHNLTLSGFNKNREITTKVRFSSLKNKDAVSFINQVWQFIRSCVEEQKGFVPDQILDIVFKITNLAPWLKVYRSGEKNDFQFLGATSKGVSLYEQLLKKVPRNAKRIVVVGPFFDRTLAFIRKLKEDFSPSELIVGIDPSTADITPSTDKVDGLRFVNSELLGLSKAYLHAKIIYFEAESGKGHLVTGSANPSSPAWLAVSKTRNGEAVVLHSEVISKQIAIELGLPDLDGAEDISSQDWESIAHRIGKKSINQSQDANFIIGTAEPGGIVFEAHAFFVKTFKLADLYDESLKLINTVHKLKQLPDKLLLPVADEDLRHVRTVSISDLNGGVFTTWVHHTADLSKRSESSRQAKFRTAMASLETDDPDLPNLINIVEKVIFDEGHEIDPKTVRRRKGSAKTGEEDDKVVKLSISYDEIKKKRVRRRIVNAGDLGLILDVLIHNLGIGLQSRGADTYSDGRDEEDLIGSDDEKSPDVPNVLSNEEIVKFCNRKVRTIINRMLKQFDRIQKQEAEYYKPLIQLVAVLALFRQLRKFESANTNISNYKPLIPEKDRKKLLYGSLTYLYGEKSRFIERAEEELVREPIDEISRLKGLLFWLAKDVRADIRPKKKDYLGIDYKKLRRESVEKARALVFATIAVNDQASFDEAKKSIYQTARNTEEANDWLERHRIWGLKFSAAVQKLRVEKKKRKGNQYPNIGDVAFLYKSGYDFFNVVYSPKNEYGQVKLVGIEGEERIFTCPASKLYCFPFPKI